MTNREKLLEEIGKLSNEQLMDLMMVGYEGLMAKTQDFGIIVCRTCNRHRSDYCAYDSDDGGCALALGGWMNQECTTDQIMEV